MIRDAENAAIAQFTAENTRKSALNGESQSVSEMATQWKTATEAIVRSADAISTFADSGNGLQAVSENLSRISAQLHESTKVLSEADLSQFRQQTQDATKTVSGSGSRDREANAVVCWVAPSTVVRRTRKAGRTAGILYSEMGFTRGGDTGGTGRRLTCLQRHAIEGAAFNPQDEFTAQQQVTEELYDLWKNVYERKMRLAEQDAIYQQQFAAQEKQNKMQLAASEQTLAEEIARMQRAACGDIATTEAECYGKWEKQQKAVRSLQVQHQRELEQIAATAAAQRQADTGGPSGRLR